MPYKNGRYVYPFPARRINSFFCEPVTNETALPASEIVQQALSIEINLDVTKPVEFIFNINGQRVQVRAVPPD